MPETKTQSLQSLMQTLQKPVEEKKSVPKTQLIIFAIDGEKYGVEITDLKEIIVNGEVTPLPNSPEFVRGILNLRGRIVAIIDLLKRINVPGYNTSGKTRQRILITEVGKDLYGIEIDEVIEIYPIEKTAIKPAPTVILNKIKESQCIKGVFLHDQKNQESNTPKAEPEIIIIFDLLKLITNNQET